MALCRRSVMNVLPLRVRRSWLCALLSLTLVSHFAWTRSVRAATNNLFAAALSSITSDELHRHVEVLADDVYEGRSAGSRGGIAAAQYIVQELRNYDLTPAGSNGDFLQVFGEDWRNILVLQPGSDARLQHELVLVGAHFDHVGRGSEDTSYGPIGRIHNGADDNASGVSMLLETIEAFATTGLRTRRSILFAFWDGEERGLKGSRYWLQHPTIAADQLKLSITLDMVGRLRHGQLFVLGTRSGYGLRRLMSGPIADPLWLDFDWELSENSDHWSFIEQQIPVVLLHTGLHEDYHRPSDDTEKVDAVGMYEISRYLLTVLNKVANEDKLPHYRMAVQQESDSLQRVVERPLPPASLAYWPSNQPRPRLGITWREDEGEPGSVFLTRVVAGTPAAAAGLQVNDRIYDVGGQRFADARAFESMILDNLARQVPAIELLVERRGRVSTVSVNMLPAQVPPQ